MSVTDKKSTILTDYCKMFRYNLGSKEMKDEKKTEKLYPVVYIFGKYKIK